MSVSRVAVIDYGMGNLHSVASAIEHVAPGVEVVVSADREIIRDAQRVVFPGVGAIRDCMAEIRCLGFDTLVPEVIASGKPILGICVGMQALMEFSEENGGVQCLGHLRGKVRFFGNDLRDDEGLPLKVPHKGWNRVQQVMPHALWQGIEDNTRFYFVHSYYVKADAVEKVVGRCDYGRSFDAAVCHDNLFAAQFHPEKSHTAGLQLLRNFVNWGGQR